jgi:hypothetical protein
LLKHNSIETIKKNGIEWVKELGRRNIEDMLKIIEWNEENVCSDVFTRLWSLNIHPLRTYAL